MTSPIAGQPAPAPELDQVRQTVATIAAHDPGFNLDAFLAEAQQAFWLVGRAHAECQPDLCRSVLSAALAAREHATIDAACRDSKAMAPNDGDASSGQLVSIDTDATSDTATVHFTSTWQAVSGGRDKPDHRVQNWCFQRPVGSRTVKTDEGQDCQNCGAALSASAGTCRYCGAVIGTGSGWHVIRIDDVSAHEAEQANAAMRTIVAELAAAREAGSQRSTSTRLGGRKRRSHPFRGPVAVVILVAALFAFIEGVTENGSLHRDVAKVLPFFRHPILSGPLNLAGQVAANGITATQAPALFQFHGSCAKQAIRTTWTFKAKLPDGSNFDLQIALPPGQGGAATYRHPHLSATADNSTVTDTWELSSTSAAVLTIRADGGGSLAFSRLAPGDTGGTPLTGHLSWTCALA